MANPITGLSKTRTALSNTGKFESRKSYGPCVDARSMHCRLVNITVPGYAQVTAAIPERNSGLGRHSTRLPTTYPADYEALAVNFLRSISLLGRLLQRQGVTVRIILCGLTCIPQPLHLAFSGGSERSDEILPISRSKM